MLRKNKEVFISIYKALRIKHVELNRFRMRILFSMEIVKDSQDKTAFMWRDFRKIRSVIKASFSKKKGKRIEFCLFWRHKKGNRIDCTLYSRKEVYNLIIDGSNKINHEESRICGL